MAEILDHNGAAITDSTGAALTDDIATITLNPTVGEQRNTYTILSNGNLTLTISSDIAIPAGALATLATGPTQTHYELTINSIESGMLVGFTSPLLVVGPETYPRPGQTQYEPGISIFTSADSGYANGGVVTMNYAPAVGDVVIFEADTATNVVNISYYRSGVKTLIYSTTVAAAYVPKAWTAFVSASRDADRGTVNFGSTAFASAPSTGFSAYQTPPSATGVTATAAPV
ncbi:MAG: hypothetical protein H0W39_06700, partial [Sphingomonas sp.]|nr:hypothetical protein [Sphingomonas sp.]